MSPFGSSHLTAFLIIVCAVRKKDLAVIERVVDSNALPTLDVDVANAGFMTVDDLQVVWAQSGINAL